MPKRIPVRRHTPNVKPRTGSDGMGLIATAWFRNASCRIRLVPQNAKTTPTIPPRRAREVLSISTCATCRDRDAPSAVLSEICCRRLVARTSMRFATLAQAIRRTKPETPNKRRKPDSYSSRIIWTPAPPGDR